MQLANQYPKPFFGIIGLGIFIYCLRYAAFLDFIAQIVAVIIMGAFVYIVIKSSSSSKKK